MILSLIFINTVLILIKVIMYILSKLDKKVLFRKLLLNCLKLMHKLNLNIIAMFEQMVLKTYATSSVESLEH